MGDAWIGVDVGKFFHHVAVLDEAGRLPYSQRVANTEPSLAAVIDDVARLTAVGPWAIDQSGSYSALLVAMLHRRGIEVVYVSGIVYSRLAKALHGERKTDAKDARIIAEALRLLPNLRRILPRDPVEEELRLLTGRRNHLVGQRRRTICWMQNLLMTISPGLCSVLDLTLRGPVYLLVCWQTPTMIRDVGESAIYGMLHERNIRNAADLAAAVTAAARAQTESIPAEVTAGEILGRYAADLRAINEHIAHVGVLLASALAQHPLARSVTSLPGMGPILAAELIAITGSMTRYPTPAALAAHAGLVPVARQSGSIDHQRSPVRYHRGLRKVLIQSSLTAIRNCPISRAYYDRKRGEGKTHRQAISALAHRRANVLWALVRDRSTFPHPTRRTPLIDDLEPSRRRYVRRLPRTTVAATTKPTIRPPPNRGHRVPAVRRRAPNRQRVPSPAHFPAAVAGLF